MKGAAYVFKSSRVGMKLTVSDTAALKKRVTQGCLSAPRAASSGWTSYKLKYLGGAVLDIT
jgi:hypothetical protein